MDKCVGREMVDLNAKQIFINANPEYWDWFKKWWLQDFSWNGLKYKTYHPNQFTGIAQPLSAVWKGEENNLITFSGRSWTLFHLPEHDLDGNLSPKHPKWNSSEIVTSAKDDRKPWGEKTYKIFKEKILERLQSDGHSGDTSFFRDKCKLTGVWFPHDKYNETEFDDFESDNSPATDIIKNLFSSQHFRTLNESIERELHIEANWCHFPNGMNFSSIKFRYSDLNYCALLFPKFLKCIFSGHCNFHNSTFIGMADFEFSEFIGVTSFDGSEFTKGPNFSYCKFLEVTEFRDINFQKNTDFSSCKFSGKTKFHGSTFHESISFQECNFDVPKASYAGIPMGEIMLADVEECYRVLKQKLIAANHQSEAYEVAMAEQIARRRRWSFPSINFWRPFGKVIPKVGIYDNQEGIPWWDALLSKLYDLGSKYGQSAIRPVINLILIFILFSIFYTSIIYSDYDLCFKLWEDTCRIYGDGIKLSSRNSFPPFTISTFPKYNFENYGFPKFGDMKLASIQFLQVLQLSISSVLVFLLVLAVKRRLQLNT